jgi:hypothetical protein
MAVKLAHYFTFIAQGGVTWMLYMAKPWLTNGGDYGPKLFSWLAFADKRLGALPTPLSDLGVFLFIMGSMYQAMAGAFFIMAVSY